MNKLPEDFGKKKIILCSEESTFEAVEGESILSGIPMLWCRTSTCNLRCSWYDKDGDIVVNCDSQHTSHFPKNKNIVTCQQLYDHFTDSKFDHIQWISISGGEPYTQPNMIKLIDYLVEAGKKVKVETNGTIYIPSKANVVMVSPKLLSSSSGLKKLADINYTKADSENYTQQLTAESRSKIYSRFLEKHNQGRYNLDSLKLFKQHSQQLHFKFVINDKQDGDEIIKDYVAPLSISAEEITVMAQGTSSELLNNKAKWIINDFCMKYGWRFSDRLHIRIWGNDMGV